MHHPGSHSLPSAGPASTCGYGPQDGRSNLAVQPAAPAARISLKKAAVKIVRPTSTMSTPAVRVAAPVVAPTRVEDGYERTPQVQAPTPEPAANNFKIEPDSISTLKRHVPRSEVESTLDALFAKLNAPSPAPRPAQKPKSTILPVSVSESSTPLNLRKIAPVGSPSKVPVGTEKKPPTLETKAAFTDKDTKTAEKLTIKSKPTEELEESPATAKTESAPTDGGDTPSGKARETMSADELEQQYLKLAAEFLVCLPMGTGADSIVLPVQAALKTFHRLALPQSPACSANEANALKRKCVAAIATYLSRLPQNSNRVLGSDAISAIFNDCNGGFLRFVAKLVDAKALQIENLSQVLGLCHVLNNVLPQEAVTEVKNATKKAKIEEKAAITPAPANPVKVEVKKDVPTAAPSTPKHPDTITTWPAQQKRDNGEFSCRLFVSGMLIVN